MDINQLIDNTQTILAEALYHQNLFEHSFIQISFFVFVLLLFNATQFPFLHLLTSVHGVRGYGRNYSAYHFAFNPEWSHSIVVHSAAIQQQQIFTNTA